MERVLVLVRHGQSEWNLRNLFTGWENPPLTKKGIQEAKQAGKYLQNNQMKFDVVFTSRLQRAEHTAKLILEYIDQPQLPLIRVSELNERNYGDLTGTNKDDAVKKWGYEQVSIWRRSYDVSPPGVDGESLKDTGARVWPYFITDILPKVMSGKQVLVVAHGNSLRALIMVLDRLKNNEVAELSLDTAVPLIYRLNADTSVASKKIFNAVI